MLKRRIIVISVLLCIISLLSSCADIVAKNSQEVEAIVTNKEFEQGYTYTTFMYSGKVMIPIINKIPDSYNVTVEYNGVTKVIDDYDLYHSVNVNDKITAIYTVTEWDDGQVDKELDIK